MAKRSSAENKGQHISKSHIFVFVWVEVARQVMVLKCFLANTNIAKMTGSDCVYKRGYKIAKLRATRTKCLDAKG